MSASMGLTDYFTSLPAAMRGLLLHGSTGRMHLVEVADAGLRGLAVASSGAGADSGQSSRTGSGTVDDTASRQNQPDQTGQPKEADQPDRPATLAACADALMHCWAESPLDAVLAGQILATAAVHPFLPVPAIPLLRLVAKTAARPADTRYFDNLRERRDFAKLAAYLRNQAEREPEVLFWRMEAVSLALFDGRFEDARALLAGLPEAFHGLASGLIGLSHLLELGGAGSRCPTAGAGGVVAGEDAPTVPSESFADARPVAGGAAAGDPRAALAAFERAAEYFGHGYAQGRMGLALARAGERGQAVERLRASLGHSPWQTSVALVVHDLEQGIAAQRTELPGDVAILLYSWNKGEELDETLAALHHSELGDARIFALDNGSTDHTPQVLKQWAQRFGQRMETVTLPVNVGAAAARNWLMHLPQVERSDWVVYLDDDAVVGKDWLAAFGAAAAQYPDAGVWGCKVLDAFAPHLIQSADYHLLLPDLPAGQDELDFATITPSPSRLSNLHVQGFDTGLFDYLRPCASVTGCCHLFRTERLLKTGDFSLFLSPSQYDDMERDLRMLSGGRFAVYSGHIPVLHKKRSGAATRTSAPQQANALGNRYKMQVMHPRGELAQAMRGENATLERDLLGKLGRL